MDFCRVFTKFTLQKLVLFKDLNILTTTFYVSLRRQIPNTKLNSKLIIDTEYTMGVEFKGIDKIVAIRANLLS